MFTGIIEAKGKVKSVAMRGKARVVSLGKPAAWKLADGQSVNVDGVCSTVARSSASSFTVEYMPETLRKTTAGMLAKGDAVNLERSLKYGDRIDGHIVQGHIEGTARVESRAREGRSLLLVFRLPKELARYAPPRGSIAVNGVSLTIARRKGSIVTVALVPHTLAHTTLGALSEGDSANVETDVMARYGRRARLR